MSLIGSLSKHWIGVTSIAYLLTFVFWRYFILPLEISLTSENAIFASFLFLPHAVRVLSAWLLGPKSLYAMIPVGVALSLASGMKPPQGYALLHEVLLATFSASSAVIAFELMRFCKIDAYPKNSGTINWRTVLFAGVLASVINSLGSTWLKSGHFYPTEMMEVISRFILGDTLGLFVGMLLLMLTVRHLRSVG